MTSRSELNSTSVHHYGELIEAAQTHGDVYKQLDRLAEFSQTFQIPTGEWIVTGFEACSLALHDAKLGTDWDALMKSVGCNNWTESLALRSISQLLISANGQEHARLRDTTATMMRAILGQSSALRRDVEDRVHRCLSSIDLRSAFDAYELLALPLTLDFICDIVGIPAPDRFSVPDLIHKVNSALDNATAQIESERIERAGKAIETIYSMFDTVLLSMDDSSGSSLLSHLAELLRSGRTSLDEAHSIALVILAGGFDTPSHVISNGLALLAMHPTQLQILRGDPNSCRLAVNEILRFDPPVTYAPRTALGTTSIDGNLIREGEQVRLLFAVANRDPRRFTMPNEFLISRPDPGHLSFGAGVHRCLGIGLAHLYADTAFRAILQALPEFSYLPPVEYQAGLGRRTIQRLNLCW